MRKDLVPIEQKEVEFYGDELTAVRVAGGYIFVPVRPICDRLGVDWNGQRRRINRDPVLRDELRTVDVTSTEGTRVVTRGVLCLPLDYISGFLFGINAERVRGDLRDRVIRYQKECYKVLAEAFHEGRLTADADFDELLATADEGVVQAYQMARAIVQLARNQILLDSRVTQTEQRLDTLEAQLGSPERYVTSEQASQISQAVKAVALALGRKTKKNEFGAIYGELYRRYSLTSYKMMPSDKFDDAMKFLTEWHQNIITDVPF